MHRLLVIQMRSLVVVAGFLSFGHAETLVAEKFVVATVNPIASEAGLAAFRDGGNAIDAAVAAALTLGVVDGHNSGIGGGCLILIRRASGEFVAIDGRERAPAAATRDMFVRDGKPVPELSQTGALASGVPGALAAYQTAIDECGELPMRRLLEAGHRAAEQGFAIDKQLASAIAAKVEEIEQFAATREVLLHDDGAPLKTGELLVQADLAASYAALREQGIDWFYRGDYAKKVDGWMRENGGLLTADDFASYRAVRREPIESTYRGYRIVGFPPPSSGGLHVAQVLNMLETFDMRALHQQSPAQAYHVIAESFSRAFADRAYWLGDSDFVNVPRGILEKSYARALAKTIDLDRKVAVPTHGDPPNWRQDVFDRHTTHIAAADNEGNWVAITATVNTSFGSKVIVPGTGIVLNNEMDDFSIQPGTPNAFGLVGAENNAVAAGKRPLSSMSPTIVVDDNDEPILTVGAAGGPKIITQVLLVMIRTIDFDESISDAIAAPRLHHQWRPDTLSFEGDMPKRVVDSLRELGHAVAKSPTAGVTQAVARGGDGKLIGVSDPRVPGKPAGE